MFSRSGPASAALLALLLLGSGTGALCHGAEASPFDLILIQLEPPRTVGVVGPPPTVVAEAPPAAGASQARGRPAPSALGVALAPQNGQVCYLSAPPRQPLRLRLLQLQRCLVQQDFRETVLFRLSARTQFHGDLFGDPVAAMQLVQPPPSDPGFDFFKQDPKTDWANLIATVAVLFAVEFLWFRRVTKTPAANSLILAFWVLVVGGVYWAIVVICDGMQGGVDWLSGYLLEWLLSVDNLFVFHLVFKVYQTPSALIQKALFIGIVGAVIFRMLFFMVLSELMDIVLWLRIALGLVLIYSGIQAARGDNDEDDPSATWPVRLMKWLLGSRLSPTYHGNSLVVRDKETGRWCVTLLFLVVCCLELTDVIFAVDSVSAKVAQIPDPYISFSSSVVAMFGLRSAFFIIKDLADYFEMLKYGLCLILVFIGLELVFETWIDLPSSVALMVFAAVFVFSIGGSMVMKHWSDREYESAGGKGQTADTTANASVQLDDGSDNDTLSERSLTLGGGAGDLNTTYGTATTAR